MNLNIRRLNKYDILVEGNRLGLSFLADLIAAQANYKHDCGFDISPNGAGSSFFKSKKGLGIYIHRLPCLSLKQQQDYKRKSIKEFNSTVRKIVKAAKLTLTKDKKHPLLFYIEYDFKKPVYFLPQFKAKSDLKGIKNKAKSLIKKERAKFYIFVSEANDIASKSRLILVQGFHRNGEFVNIGIPFREENSGIKFGRMRKSTDSKTSSGVFSKLFK